MIKNLFERTLLSARVFVLLPVIFGMLSSIILFVVATVDLFVMLKQVWLSFIVRMQLDNPHALIVGEIIGAVDLYLIAIVLLIFSFGIYELFIAEVDDEETKIPSILAISSLDELKDKLAKVIVMVLVVSYFRQVFYIEYTGPLEMMYFAISITALSVGVYLLHKDSKHKKK